MLGLVLIAGCGGDPEQERVDLLASDPGASLTSHCDAFRTQVGEKTDWTVKGPPKTGFTAATEYQLSTSYSEGALTGRLEVVLADGKGTETPFLFGFASEPVYGVWRLRSIGVLGEHDAIQTFTGDTDAFYAVDANPCRHPSHPDAVGP